MLGRPNLFLLYGARLLVIISSCDLLLIATGASLGLLCRPLLLLPLWPITRAPASAPPW